LAVVSWIVFGALYLTMPPSPDQFNHMYLGWRWLNGDTMYVDVIDMNWPGTLAAHALSVAIFGTHLWSWRAFDLACFALACVCLHDITLQAAGQRAARVFVVLAPATYVANGYWMGGQHDMGAAQCLVVGVWCWLRSETKQRQSYTLAAGAAFGLAMLYKPTVGIVFLLLPAHALWSRWGWQRALAGTLVAGLAALATLLVAVAAVLALGTPLAALVDATYTYNAIRRVNLPTPWNDLAKLASWKPALTVALCAPVIKRLWFSPHCTAAGASLAVLVTTGLLSFLAQGGGQHYHLAPAVLAFIPIAAMLVASAWEAWTQRGAPLFARLGLGALALALLCGIAYRVAVPFQALPQALSSGDYDRHLARFRENDGLTLADVSTFVRHIEATDTSACVLNVGAGSAINVLSQRRQPTRFYYYPVIIHSRPPLPMAQAWIDLWEQDLAKTRCRYVLVATRVWQHEGVAGPEKASNALRKLLLSYELVGELGTDGMKVYERRTDTGPTD
jgi:Dolichyl-phosphate-mannose-protein mannosyltransferase